MEHERTMEDAIREAADELKFRRITEDRAKALYEEYDHLYHRAVETRRGDPVWCYTMREACGWYLQEEFGVTEWLTLAGYRT